MIYSVLVPNNFAEMSFVFLVAISLCNDKYFLRVELSLCPSNAVKSLRLAPIALSALTDRLLIQWKVNSSVPDINLSRISDGGKYSFSKSALQSTKELI